MDNLKGLSQFIYEANQNSYASDSSVKSKEKDGSTTIVFEKGVWKSHDNYFGGEPYGGRQVIFKNGKAVWMTTYYGYVDKDMKKIDKVYKFLMSSLKKNSPARPFRGPYKYQEDNFEYLFKMKGDVSIFWGVETIKENGRIIYRAWHNGGLIDIRK